MISLLETLQEVIFFVFFPEIFINQEIAVHKYDILINRPSIKEDAEGHHRKGSSFIEMMPDFEGNILKCQGYLIKLKTNNGKIQDLKEKHNKTVAPNKEKGNFLSFIIKFLIFP